MTYGKPALYSRAMAPFVRLAPVRGAAINALFLLAAAIGAARGLRAAAGDAAPWLAACFVFASVAFAHVFWAHPDLFLLDLVAIGLALAYGGEVPSRPQFDDCAERRFTRRWLAAGALLGAVIACRPFYGALLLPAAAAASARPGAGERSSPSGAAPCVTLVLSVGADLAARGSVTSYGAERLSFSATGFPLVSQESAGWQRASRRAAARARGSLPAACCLTLRRPFVGLRHPLSRRRPPRRPAALLPACRPWAALLPPRGGRAALLVGVALVAAGFFAVRPYNFYGGGGALGNRYLLPVYPAFWFLVARPVRRAGDRGNDRGGAVPLSAVVGAAGLPGPRRADTVTSRAWRRWLPYETTQSHLKPGGGEDFVHHGLWIKPWAPRPARWRAARASRAAAHALRRRATGRLRPAARRLRVRSQAARPRGAQDGWGHRRAHRGRRHDAHPRQTLRPAYHLVDERGFLPLPPGARRAPAGGFRARAGARIVTTLAGRLALVTGASGAIGGAVARALGREGVAVMLAGRDRARLTALADELGGATREIAECDFTAPGEAARLAARLAAEYSSLDILVHAAGLFLDGDLAGADDRAFERLLAVNLARP
jgi:hypothetical protein